MEPIYTKHVTTLPDQGGEGTSRLLRHLDPAARRARRPRRERDPERGEGDRLPRRPGSVGCAGNAGEPPIAQGEAAARGDRIRSGLARFGEDVGEEAVSTRAPMGEAASAFADDKLAEAGAHVTGLAGEDKLLTKAHNRLERRQSLQTTIEGIVSCAKTEALLPKKNGNGWALAVKDAEAWGRAAVVAEPVPDVAAMAREKRKERRRSKGDKSDAKRAAAKKKKEATARAALTRARARTRREQGRRTKSLVCEIPATPATGRLDPPSSHLAASPVPHQRVETWQKINSGIARRQEVAAVAPEGNPLWSHLLPTRQEGETARAHFNSRSRPARSRRGGAPRRRSSRGPP